jgi:hypothetical protein
MSEPQHTPGPWKDNGYMQVVSPLMATVATTGCTDSTPIKEQLANARLIAAAPDLLDALRRLHRLSGQLIDEPSARIAKALASSAIYKATATNTPTK